MRRQITLVVVLIASVSSLPAQEPWTAEVISLHRSVFERPINENSLDIDSAQRLALLYFQGRLVPQDQVLGCSLLTIAAQSALFRHHFHNHPVVVDAERLSIEYCGRIPYAQQVEALNSTGCWVFGLNPPEIFNLDSGYWVEVTRRSVRIQSPRGTFDRERDGVPLCLAHYALTRYTRVDPPGDIDLPVRHFIESALWRPHQVGQRRLEWLVEEVKRDNYSLAAYENLLTEPGSSFPLPEVPRELTSGVTLRMKRDGTVEYRIDGRFQRRGIIE